MSTVRDEIIARYPGLSSRRNRSPLAAIRLNCVECMGGDRGEAANCQERGCFLWPFGLAARRLRLAARPPSDPVVCGLESVLTGGMGRNPTPGPAGRFKRKNTGSTEVGGPPAAIGTLPEGKS